MPEDYTECGSCTVISIDSLHVCERKSNLEVFLDNCAYKHVDKRMIDCACQNLFETDENYLLSCATIAVLQLN